MSGWSKRARETEYRREAKGKGKCPNLNLGYFRSRLAERGEEGSTILKSSTELYFVHTFLSGPTGRSESEQGGKTGVVNITASEATKFRAFYQDNNQLPKIYEVVYVDIHQGSTHLPIPPSAPRQTRRQLPLSKLRIPHAGISPQECKLMRLTT